jgi:hypothetical protein
MKKTLIILLTLGCILLSEAQIDRSIGNSQYKNSIPDRKEQKIDPIEKSLLYLEKELNLDVFQKAAIKAHLEENKEVNAKIMASNISDADKKMRLEDARENLNIKVSKILNPVQLESFNRIKDNDRSNDKESKKKRKEEKAKKKNNQDTLEDNIED